MTSSSPPVHPVAIIGGGPIGLSASILLSLRKIPHILFERHAGTSIHPKACGINQRTTEIFRQMGIYDEVKAIACPDDIKVRTAWYTSLGKDGADGRGGNSQSVDGREIWSRYAWGGGPAAVEYEKHSPARYEILPQIRLEPLLEKRARELNPDVLKYDTEVTDLEERDGCVALNILTRKTGANEEVFARFVIAADGGRSITDKLGIKWLGERNILDMVTVHLRAPIRARHPDPRNFITWFTHPDAGGSIRTGYLYQIGPWPFDNPEDGSKEEWVFACAPSLDDPVRSNPHAMNERIRNTLKLEDLPIEIISTSYWNVNALSAEKYRKGRIFLAGDAAHRIPPWGALGMNTGVQDVQNLVWKLQLALQDEKRFNSLLESYDIERRPIGRCVGQSSLYNMRSHTLVMDAALGMSPENSAEENRKAIMSFFDEKHPEHEKKRRAVEQASKVLDLEFKAPGAEAGWFYPGIDEATDKDHAPHLRKDDSLRTEIALPSTVPGHHLPHVWIYKEGKKEALRDLLPLGKLLLIADDDPGWEMMESDLVEIQRVTTTGTCEEWAEPGQEWESLLGDNEAVLVRPDGIIAWRGSWQDSLPQLWPIILERAFYIGNDIVVKE
ncbi:2,4-dichlorophenol 6-monooxygenase [Cytospora mali]|uniref:2,4-dichlorophenol 6-monooxygenase n=1 Tax=Cytospora mali TaxID=578113 RepID=A0A194VP68_CYTMA|nr:2,4-dichlorophenol 6-monooxygenase [Valsa mali]